MREREQYFLENVDLETDECIVWPFGKSKNGYGLVKIAGKSRAVHVLAAARHLGPRPSGHDVAHGECHDRACFNHRHLAYKTRAQNVADMRRDGTHLAGEANGRHVLTGAQVRDIRERTEPSTHIAAEYGVVARHIRAIRSRRFWKELT